MSVMKPVSFPERESWFYVSHQIFWKNPMKFCKYRVFPIAKGLSSFSIFKNNSTSKKKPVFNKVSCNNQLIYVFL